MHKKCNELSEKLELNVFVVASYSFIVLFRSLFQLHLYLKCPGTLTHTHPYLLLQILI